MHVTYLYVYTYWNWTASDQSKKADSQINTAISRKWASHTHRRCWGLRKHTRTRTCTHTHTDSQAHTAHAHAHAHIHAHAHTHAKNRASSHEHNHTHTKSHTSLVSRETWLLVTNFWTKKKVFESPSVTINGASTPCFQGNHTIREEEII